MKTQRFIKHACLALLLFTSAGVTQAAEGIAGQNNVPVFRITGWDGWTRQSGTVQHKP